MTKEYWQTKWRNNDITFHEGRVNIHFANFAKEILASLKKPSRIFFPLCGKTIDMVEARNLGHCVVGVELCEQAIIDFFTENQFQIYDIISDEKNGIKLYKSDKIELYCGNILTMNLSTFNIDFIFDRAALVALSESDRKIYAQNLTKALKPGKQIVLVSQTYDDGLNIGPPYSVSEKEVFSLFTPSFSLQKLLSKETIEDYPFLKAKGLSSFKSDVYLLTKI